jgi:thiamine biosynthesis lipoprotein ApbE
MPSWLVGVAGLEIGSLRGTLKLTAGALSTSRALPAGDEAGAIVDPRTGLTITPPVLATVHASNATHAEVWSTALVVLGPSGIEKAQQAGVTAIVETATKSVQSDRFPMISGAGEKSPSPTPDAK